MTIWVTEVDTPAAIGPRNLAGDLNSVSPEMRFPLGQFLSSYSKTNVYGACTIVGRNELRTLG